MLTLTTFGSSVSAHAAPSRVEDAVWRPESWPNPLQLILPSRLLRAERRTVIVVVPEARRAVEADRVLRQPEPIEAPGWFAGALLAATAATFGVLTVGHRRSRRSTGSATRSVHAKDDPAQQGRT